MDKKNIIEEMIRVNHAGERGAIKIYEGQIKALKFLKQEESLIQEIQEMRDHELEHLHFFENEIIKRNVRPTFLLPLWDLLGTTLGIGTALLGKKATALCTAAVEEVIGGHYSDQIETLENDFKEEKSLKDTFSKFRDDELEHKDKAEKMGSTNSGVYYVLDTIIKGTSRLAIEVSKRI
ncbi:MAG: demethoxyubiquinone hydroxylase family protein [Pelagibacterales bacterium]|nr:demethoxyubiquinone hydroxylase family protein [Pelagibacterales bacterium]